jgi:hypothetical protein
LTPRADPAAALLQASHTRGPLTTTTPSATVPGRAQPRGSPRSASAARQPIERPADVRLGSQLNQQPFIVHSVSPFFVAGPPGVSKSIFWVGQKSGTNGTR